MIVCHCRVVTDRAVAEVVRGGTRSLAGVCRSTGAGQDCGGCVFSLKRLVCEHGTPSTTGLTPSLTPSFTEADVAAS